MSRSLFVVAWSAEADLIGPMMPCFVAWASGLKRNVQRASVYRMQAQRQELLNQLPEHGWQIVGQEEELQWWADEMWRIESLWSPVGSLAYVTFLVDPQSHHERKTGDDVWAVMASIARPASRLNVEGEFTVSLGRGWKQELPAFFEHLAFLRGQQSSSP